MSISATSSSSVTFPSLTNTASQLSALPIPVASASFPKCVPIFTELNLHRHIYVLYVACDNIIKFDELNQFSELDELNPFSELTDILRIVRTATEPYKKILCDKHVEAGYVHADGSPMLCVPKIIANALREEKQSRTLREKIVFISLRIMEFPKTCKLYGAKLQDKEIVSLTTALTITKAFLIKTKEQATIVTATRNLVNIRTDLQEAKDFILKRIKDPLEIRNSPQDHEQFTQKTKKLHESSSQQIAEANAICTEANRELTIQENITLKLILTIFQSTLNKIAPLSSEVGSLLAGEEPSLLYN